jgi:hypothetical protein
MPIGFDTLHPDLHIRFETIVAGNDNTGPDAAESQGWIDRLFAG